jgi:hypothetical protein
MLKANLRNIQTDPNYKPLSAADLDAYGFSGIHTVLVHVGDGRMVICLVKSQKGNDFSLSEYDTDAGRQAHRDGMRSVYVAQIDPDRPDRILAWETLKNVLRNIGDIQPRDGKHGPDWYIKAKTFLVGGSAAKRETWAPGTLMEMLREGRRANGNGNGNGGHTRRRPRPENDDQLADY